MDKLKKKFGIDWGIGIMTENPDKFQNKETKYQKRFWVKYDGYWYLTALLPHLHEQNHFIDKVSKAKTKEEFEELLISIIK